MWRKLAIVTLMLVALVIFGIQPAQAQQDVVWNTEFFNNLYLLAPAAVHRQDSAIAFDWQYGSPASNVNADNFSARWAADPYFPAGTYRFYALVDDSVCIWVDFQRLLDTFNQPRMGQTLTIDITLEAGIHHIQVDYRENWGVSYLFMTWANLATNPAGPNFQVPVQQLPSVNTSPIYLTTQYYNNASLVGMPNFVQTETWPLVRNWGNGSPLTGVPADNFSARWTSIQAVNAGTYRITARADDGVRVYIDGQLTINEFHAATGITYTVDVPLIAGQHNLMVEYYEAGGVAFVEITFSPLNVSVQPQAVINQGGTLKVTADLLNLRASPNCDCSVLAKVRYGETFPITGRNADSSWWQINVNGTVGWVFGRFAEVYNVAYVPLTDYSSTIQLPTIGYTVTTTATTVLRNHPGNRNAYMGFIPAGYSAQVVGRNADASWWQVNYNGMNAWIRAGLTTIEPIPNLSQIPIHG